MRRWRVLAAAVLAITLPLIAEHEPPALAPKAARALPTSNEAVLFALRDTERMSPLDTPFIRYLWWPSMDVRDAKAATLAINVVSRSDILWQLPPVTGYLLRVDLRWFAPRADDLVEWLRLWEDFAFDPAFSLLITKDELANLSARDRERIHAWQRQRQRQRAPVANPALSFTRTDATGLGRHALIVVSLPVDADLWIEGDATSSTGPMRTLRTPALPDDDVYEYTIKIRSILNSGESVVTEGKVEVAAGCRTEVVVTSATESKPASTTSAIIDLIRFDRDDIDATAFQRLQQLTGSGAPVVSVPYFLQRALTTIKDKGVYAQVFGGRYYDLVGIKKAKDTPGAEDKTDEDVFLAKVGAGDVSLKGFTAEQVFNQLRSDMRVAMFHSNVTGKPRRVDLLPSRADAEGQNKGFVTHDIRREDVDVNQHPIMNLARFTDAAREAIFPKANGLHYYALFNGKGDLLDAADINVVSDRTVPEPYEPELQSALSCIACHEARGHDGWQPVANDVLTLTGQHKDALRLDTLTDISVKNDLQVDVLLRIAGQYRGEFSFQLTRARNDYARAVLRAAGPWPDSDNQVQVVKTAMTHLVNTTRGYQYDRVDAYQALRELGLEVPKEQAVAVLNRVLLPDANARIGDFFLEDPRIGAIKQGLSVPRHDWAMVEGFAAQRAQKRMALYRKANPQ